MIEDRWLISKACDFWLGCAGAGLVLAAMAALLRWHGDRALDTADLLLSELHLGATYGAIARARLWRSLPWDVLAMPAAILVAAYALLQAGQSVLVTTAILYLAAWHRARQSFGIARVYQSRCAGTPPAGHKRLFLAAIYLPMLAGLIYFNGASALYEGDDYAALAPDPGLSRAAGLLALLGLGGYLLSALRHRRAIHPGEVWLVLANAVAFASAYVLGARNASYILVLAIHHEVQYLYFTYALARRARPPGTALRRLGAFALWPLLGLGSWAACQTVQSEGMAAFLVGGLLCHYWLDARIWTARARRAAAA